ncbi:MAG: GGDEF domain-containing protein [Lachnospiraceae bacterium]|nr:GGDEF domain-containing protein [Lachnospiraceae bacterium]
MGKILKFLSNAKNKVFLSTCLAVHIISFIFYLQMGSVAVAVVNAISSLIYVILLITHYKDSDGSIVIAFFEIMCFSILSELLLSGNLGYMYFPLGMVSVISHLVSGKKTKIFLLQLVGIITTVIIFFIDADNIMIKIGPQVDYDEIRYCIIFSNILVALINMMYVSFLYLEGQERNRAALQYSIDHDPLTGLYNRRFFYAHVNDYESYKGKYAIAMMDIDNFKSINDNYGHKLGDAALVSMADILKASLNETDIAVRWGGEEFIVFMPDTDENIAFESLSAILEKIRNNVTTLDDKKVSFTVTIGLAVKSKIADFEKAINDADRRLYRGKNNGKNKIVK